jgi:dTDP-4-dehydrorhamnose 3,5-epimerase
VAVDLRSDSLTFGKYKTFRLKEKEHIAVLIPAGFAHGFLSLEDSIFSYQSIGTYVPENCSGIIWNDKELNIPWPVDEIKCPLIISEKDKVLQTFLEYKQHNNR